jgi:hypothetical protein
LGSSVAQFARLAYFSVCYSVFKVRNLGKGWPNMDKKLFEIASKVATPLSLASIIG